MIYVDGIMHPEIAALATRLFALDTHQPAAPTQWDRDNLMAVRHLIKQLRDDKLTERDETDCEYLYLEATRLANQQEEFYENNGNKWAKRPYAEMCPDEARSAIRTCLRRKVKNGVSIEDIQAALREEVGITTYVALNIHPEPANGRLPGFGRLTRFQVDFMANAANGEVIS